MTNKEAIARIQEHILIHSEKEPFTPYLDEAFDMAIRALLDMDTLKNLPVKPVVKSYWTTKRTEQHDGEWYCANCGYEPIVFEGTPYCPNCGARMDEELQ